METLKKQFIINFVSSFMATYHAQRMMGATPVVMSDEDLAKGSVVTAKKAWDEGLAQVIKDFG